METTMIGNKIAEARKKTNISQAQLAQQLFISAQAVGKWERGESMPDIITLNRLAKILGVDLNYFSENFQSTVNEIAPVEFPINQSDELPSRKMNQPTLPSGRTTGKTGNKLSWDMSRGNWVDADFSGLKNLHEKFSSSNMQRCKFIGSDLSGLLLKSNNVDKCDFSGSNISNSQMQNSNLGNNLYIDSDMSGLQLKSNNVNKCDFTDSNLSNGQIQSSNFDGNQFKGCSLKETEFTTSHIYGCDFTGADFTNTVFKTGGFGKNTIVNAVWNHTSFITMWLTDIIFEGTIDDCYFENCSFKKVIFQNSKLTNTFFKNKSLKGIRFIDCQADRMTYEFLKNGKANLSGISLITS